MSVSYSIMAHPDRAGMVIDLLAELGDVQIAWDRGVSRWDTGARAWAEHDSAAKWHVVVQDDAILCDNFVARVSDFLQYEIPDRPVSFYLGAGRPRQRAVTRAISTADDMNDDRISLPWLLWGVCFALPVAHIADMLSECRTGMPNYDSRISRYYERRKISALYSWPSLVDHRDEASLTYGNLDVPRVAHRFAGSNRNWTGVSP